MTRQEDTARTISCPNCGGTLEVRAAGYSVNLGCRYCGSLLDVSRPEVALIEAHRRALQGLRLPLGRRGTLFGAEWEVLGALRRKDDYYAWEEYLLFNPYAGYRWLVLSAGEWQFGTMLLDLPERHGDAAIWRGQRYVAEDEEQTTVTTGVVGEFYWRVHEGDSVQALLFERGTEGLSCEGDGGEMNWTQLVAVDDAAVASAFGLETPRPRRRAAREPFAAFASEEPRETPGLGAMFGLACAALVALLVAMVFVAGPVDRASGGVNAPFARTLEGVKVGTIAVRRPWQFVTISADAGEMDNRWVDLDYSLVDRATGQSIDGYGLIEHYSGTDSDGRWTEGSGRTTTLLGQVPRGTYDLYVDAAAHGWPSDPPADSAVWSAQPDTVTVTIHAETGALPWGNWWTAAVLLFAFPGIIAWRRFRSADWS